MSAFRERVERASLILRAPSWRIESQVTGETRVAGEVDAGFAGWPTPAPPGRG
jgi:hypothetical protein